MRAAGVKRSRGEHPDNSNKPPGAEEEEEEEREAAVFLVLNSCPRSGWYFDRREVRSADDSGLFWGFKKKKKVD